MIKAFTPICAVPGYANYGLCGGRTTTFSGVSGKMNAIQPKPGRYNLDFTFGGLSPGVEYRLWATRDAVPFDGTWLEVGRRSRTTPVSSRSSIRRTRRAGSAST